MKRATAAAAAAEEEAMTKHKHEHTSVVLFVVHARTHAERTQT